MSPYESWKTEAMRLAEVLCEASIAHDGESRGVVAYCRTRDAVQAARAALEAHLEALPMGAAVAWSTGIKWPEREHALTEQVIKLTRRAQPEYGFSVPLYRHPKESA